MRNENGYDGFGMTRTVKNGNVLYAEVIWIRFVHECVGCLTDKMTSKSGNSCITLSRKPIHHGKIVPHSMGKISFQLFSCKTTAEKANNDSVYNFSFS